MKIYLSTQRSQTWGWMWMGLSDAGGIKQEGFATEAAARKAAKAERFAKHVVPVYTWEREDA